MLEKNLRRYYNIMMVKHFGEFLSQMNHKNRINSMNNFKMMKFSNNYRSHKQMFIVILQGWEIWFT